MYGGGASPTPSRARRQDNSEPYRTCWLSESNVGSCDEGRSAPLANRTRGAAKSKFKRDGIWRGCLPLAQTRALSLGNVPWDDTRKHHGCLNRALRPSLLEGTPFLDFFLYSTFFAWTLEPHNLFLLINFLCFSYLYFFPLFCHAHPSVPSFCHDSTVLFPTASRTQCIQNYPVTQDGH